MALWIIAVAAPAVAAAIIILVITRARARSIRALNEKRYNILESIADGIYIVDDRWRFTHVNEQAETMLRRTAGTLVGMRVQDVLDPLASELFPELKHVKSAGKPKELVQFFQSTNTWIEVRVQPARDELLVYLRDITERKKAEMQLRESEQRLRLILSQAPAVLWTCDLRGRITSISGALLAERGLSEDRVIGAPMEMLFGADDAKKRALAELRHVIEGEAVRFETYEHNRWMQNDFEPLRDEKGRVIGAAGVSLDVTEVRETANRFAELARQDAMTQLPNRLALDEVLPALFEEATQQAETVAIFFVDIDRFKTINDTLGHRAGDTLLQAVAERLKAHLPSSSLMCRFGGDEFVIALRSVASRRAAAEAAASVLSLFSQTFQLEGRELAVSASVGVSLFPQNGLTADELIAYADAAMYRAKEAGGNNTKFYDGSMHAHALERMGLEQDIRFALARGELALVFQPIVDTVTRRIVAAEALLRWNHPLLGELLPHTFVPIAEETGVIVEISRWVMHEACRTAARVRESLMPDFRVAVNLSPRDFYESDFVATLTTVLERTNLPATALDLEVTENVMVNDASAAVLSAVAEMGVRVCVDDFGTGYSALAYLKRFPVDAIKIDKTFVQDIARDPHDEGIVKAMCTLAETLGLRVVAEGVETQAQFELVKNLGCRFVQGFYFYRPQSWQNLRSALEEMAGMNRPYMQGQVIALHR